MKKGIVMEKHRQYTIVMTREGKFQKAKPVKSASIGAEISYEAIEEKKQFLFFFHPRKINNTFRLIAMTCILLLIIMPFYFITDSNKTYAYVNIDINPSIELEIDEELQVRSIIPLNDDAMKLVEELRQYQGKKLDELLSNIMDKSEEAGLIKNGKNVLVGVSYVNSNEISVLETLDSYFLQHQTDWNIATFQVPKKVRASAKEREKSMNELMATTLVKENTSDDDVENFIEKIPMDDEEKAIINSFYNNDKTNDEKTDKKEQDKKTSKLDESDSTYESKHPSELKGKNGIINSNKKNKEHKMNSNKGENDVAKEKRNQKAKPNNSNNKNAHNKGKNKDKHKDEHKDRHKHKDKHKEKDNNKNRGNGKQKDKPNHPHN